MKKVSILLFVLLHSFTSFAQHSVRKNLRDIATITFPDTPDVKVKGEDTVYTTLAQGSGLVYIAAAGEGKKSQRVVHQGRT